MQGEKMQRSVQKTAVCSCAVKLSRAVDEPVFTTPFEQNNATLSKHVYLYIYGFQFTSSDLVHFEVRDACHDVRRHAHLQCQVMTCVNMCPKQCQQAPTPTTKLMAGRPPMENHTIKATLRIVPQAPSARS